MAALGGAGIAVEKPRDLLFLLPVSVIDRRPVADLRDAVLPATVTLTARVASHHPPRLKGKPYRVLMEDAGQGFQLVFFHARADYLERLLPPGQIRLVSGRAEVFDGVAQFVHPDHVLPLTEAGDLPAFEPVYPLAAGVSQRQLARAASAAIARAPDPAEWIDPALLAREGWPGWHESLRQAHAPEALADLAATAPARARLAYDEMFAHQLTLALVRRQQRRGKGRASVGTGERQRRVLAALPSRRRTVPAFVSFLPARRPSAVPVT